jgi:hypothetical protein
MVLVIDVSVEFLVLKTAICVIPCLEDCNLCDGFDDFHVRGGLDDLDDVMFMMTLTSEGSMSMILAVTVVSLMFRVKALMSIKTVRCMMTLITVISCFPR